MSQSVRMFMRIPASLEAMTQCPFRGDAIPSGKGATGRRKSPTANGRRDKRRTPLWAGDDQRPLINDAVGRPTGRCRPTSKAQTTGG